MALTIEGPTPSRPDPAGRDIVLPAELADAYVDRLSRAVAAARLNSLFPPESGLRSHFGFLGHAGSAGLHDQLRLSPVNGLPIAREILRVKIDRDLAAEFLADAARLRPPQQDSRMARRIDYYRRLATAEVLPVHRMRVELRQQIPEDNCALFRVTFDRFDLAGNQFVRYTILLAQHDSFWRRRQLVVDDAELAAPTRGFRNIVARFASDEAEVAFVLLSKVDGIEVEDVRRCRVGPFLLPGLPVDPALGELLAAEPAPSPPWILCFPEDRAGIEVAAHSAGDPLAPLLRDAVGDSSRELYDQMADQLGYRVAKSRKFVCPGWLRGSLDALCRRVGAPSIIRVCDG